ncbi:TPA: hypothetical protein ACXJQH_001781 [Pseudomonas aeruginosa]
MSSTQHQLIEQCAIRLRGIVEALDNIHDSTQHRSPHRWSTDLDDVHSSAESLLSLIKDQAPTQAAQGLAGAALAQPSQSQYEASFEEWLANELEGEDGQPVPAAVCDIALARRAFNHWPKLEHPAKVGGVRFSAGVSSRLVVEAAQRLYEFESTPEKEAERIERLQAFREQLDPLNLAPHAEAFNEAPADALRPEQAEAERPEVEEVSEFEREDIARSAFETAMADGISLDSFLSLSNTLAARYDRIVGALRAERDGAIKLLGQSVWQKIQLLTQQRDAALARVAELERQEPVATVAKVPGEDWNSLDFHRDLQDMQPGTKLYAAPVARAQHSVPEGWMLVECGIWTQEQVDEMQKTVTRFRNSEFVDDRALAMAVADAGQCKAPEISLAELLATAPGKEVPQAWIDVQAERRRQITAEGWTPEHDDLYCAAELPRAAAAYILNGANDEAPAIWPFVAKWWKPRDARSNYVRASALILAEIERLDRAAATQGGPRDA